MPLTILSEVCSSSFFDLVRLAGVMEVSHLALSPPLTLYQKEPHFAPSVEMLFSRAQRKPPNFQRQPGSPCPCEEKWGIWGRRVDN